MAHVTSPVPGRVTRVFAQLGRRVAKGAPLAVITSPELAHVVPDKLKAEAYVAAAEGENQRQRQLFDAHEGVTERLEAARAELASAQAELERARARAALVKSLAGDEMTGSFTLFAPRRGVVLASAAAAGSVVAGQGSGRWRARPVHGRDPGPGLGNRPDQRCGPGARPGRGEGHRPGCSLLPGEDIPRAGRPHLRAGTWVGTKVAVRCAVANTGGGLKPGMAATAAIVVAAHLRDVGPIAGLPRRRSHRRVTLILARSRPGFGNRAGCGYTDAVSRVSWDRYFMNLAVQAATRSTRPRKSVGAVVVRDKALLATGNGSIRGLAHCAEAGCLMENGHRARTVHAEANAILQAARHGVRIEGADIYATASPCWDCFKLIANAGIVRVLYGEFYRDERIREFARDAVIRLADPSVEGGVKRRASSATQSGFSTGAAMTSLNAVLARSCGRARWRMG